MWNPLDFLPEFTSEPEVSLQEIYDLSKKIRGVMHEYNILFRPVRTRAYGREVGDDRIDLSASATAICCNLAVQEMILQMDTSPEDTGISRMTWDFCEQMSVIPTDPQTSFEFARKTGDFSSLGFNDSIVLRLILDVQKDAGNDHSSTPVGKVSMLGSRLRTPRKEARGIWHLASLFQDALLSTHRGLEPKYLPLQMGGTGVTALFDNPDNVYLFVRAYRGGAYARIYGTAVHELDSCLSYLERGVQVSPILCSRLREKQEYFWGTYDNMVFVPEMPRLRTNADEVAPTPLYSRTGGVNRYQAFENRLLRTRHLVTRSQAEREWDHTQRLRSLVLSIWDSTDEMKAYDAKRRRQLKHRYDGALSTNTALQNLLKREATLKDARRLMGDSAFRVITQGQRDFTHADARWVYSNGQKEYVSLADISFSEDVFIREEVSSEETFKVEGIPLNPKTGKERSEPLISKTRVGLWQINGDMYDWADRLVTRLHEEKGVRGRPLNPSEIGPIFDSDPEWVNDDSGLIARCLREHQDSAGHTYSVIVITADKRLCNQMAETANLTVLRVHPDFYIGRCWEEGVDLMSDEGYRVLDGRLNLSKYRPDRVYLDTGSITAFALKYEPAESGRDYLTKRKLLFTGFRKEDGRRFSRVRLTPTQLPVQSRPVIHRPVTRPKTWRGGSRPQSSIYSEHSSWRRSDADSVDSWRSKPP